MRGATVGPACRRRRRRRHFGQRPRPTLRPDQVGLTGREELQRAGGHPSSSDPSANPIELPACSEANGTPATSLVRCPDHFRRSSSSSISSAVSIRGASSALVGATQPTIQTILVYIYGRPVWPLKRTICQFGGQTKLPLQCHSHSEKDRQ